jgi:FlaA1/EpsC-like NDP-sugar epimerase
VLDMGEPVSVNDVAKRLIEQSDRDIDIVYTGLRPGEKLHEVLLGSDEADHRPAHHLISHVTVAPLGRGAINEFHFDRPAAEVILQLQQVATGDAHDRPPEVMPDSAPAKAPAVTSPTEVVSGAVVSRRSN